MTDSLADRTMRLAQEALAQNSSRMSQNEILEQVRAQTDQVLSTQMQRHIMKGKRYLTEAEQTFGMTNPGQTTNLIDVRYDQRKYWAENAADLIEGDDAELHAPANFSGADVQAPTPTSKIDRPRTIAAAFDEERQVLTIIFSTGVIYNYYSVTVGEWITFKNLSTKWRYIRDVLDGKPRGYASQADIPPQLQHLAHRAYRTAQIGKALS
jgi:KTSC domain